MDISMEPPMTEVLTQEEIKIEKVSILGNPNLQWNSFDYLRALNTIEARDKEIEALKADLQETKGARRYASYAYKESEKNRIVKFTNHKFIKVESYNGAYAPTIRKIKQNLFPSQTTQTPQKTLYP